MMQGRDFKKRKKRLDLLFYYAKWTIFSTEGGGGAEEGGGVVSERNGPKVSNCQQAHRDGSECSAQE